MKKHELLEQAITKTRTGKVRSGFQREIINALPSGIDFTKVFTGPGHVGSRSSSQGIIEIEVADYEAALGLTKIPELKPTPTSRIIMERAEQGFVPTISYYPDMLIPKLWVNQHTVEAIYPVIFQMTPKGGGVPNPPKVYLEWFIKIRQGMCANVRAFVQETTCEYKPHHQEIIALGYPRGDDTRKLQMFGKGPDYITVSWAKAKFLNGNFNLLDVLVVGGGSTCHEET